MVLHEGSIAEMKTGEGKTLVATLPTYLNALTGKGVHVVTVNDYLAERDGNWYDASHAWQYNPMLAVKTLRFCCDAQAFPWVCQSRLLVFGEIFCESFC